MNFLCFDVEISFFLISDLEFESAVETRPFAIETIKIENDCLGHSSKFAPSSQPGANSSDNLELDESISSEMTLDPFESNENEEDEHGGLHLCEAGGETFDDLNSCNADLQNHDREGIVSSPHKCMTCGQSFKSDKRLKNHMSTHGTRSFKCDECGKSFKTKRNLKQHLKTHADLRPYACDQCNSTFLESQHLTKHKKAVHEGLRPYQCEQCGRRFAVSLTSIPLIIISNVQK